MTDSKKLSLPKKADSADKAARRTPLRGASSATPRIRPKPLKTETPDDGSRGERSARPSRPARDGERPPYERGERRSEFRSEGRDDPRGAPRHTGERPPRRFDDRPSGERYNNERTERDRSSDERRFSDRPRGEGNFSDRPPRERSFGDRPQRERNFENRERPFGDRPPRERNFSDRPRGEGNFNDRPPRERSFGERPRGEGNFRDRPPRERSVEDRPRRPYNPDVPARPYAARDDRRPAADRPRREFDDRPTRAPHDARESDNSGTPKSFKSSFNRERQADTFNAPRRRPAYADESREENRRPYERRTRGEDGPSAHTTARAPRENSIEAATQDPNAPMRLAKRMAELGLCSRREADEYIERGWVKVDGEVINTLGHKIHPDQKIELNRQAESTQHKRLTFLLHKPVGYVSGQAEDGYEPACVLISPENHWEEDPNQTRLDRRYLSKLAPAGRLDIDSTGLLVLTQDGRIAKQLIGETSDIEKEYLVRVEGPLSYDDLALLNHGLTLDGVPLQPAKVSWQNEHQLRFVLREGRKRQIRRMCELVGLRVTALKRIRIGSINLAKLPPGKWRYLGEFEKF